MKRVLRMLVAMLVGATGAVVVADAARADVVVRPGASGSICSEYTFVTRNPNRYFQVCMHADASRVWSVLHVGNASETTWRLDSVVPYFIRSDPGGSPFVISCDVISPFSVRLLSVTSTIKANCNERRPHAGAAYQAEAQVEPVNNQIFKATSDTLQVQ